jgi:orotate phosphoribosyltransferase
MSTPREQLLQTLAEKSFRLGEFKLASGGTSDYYIDCRATTLSGEGARLVARVFYDEIYNSGLKPSAVGGLTLGADPIVTAIAMLSAQRNQGRAADRPGAIGDHFELDAFVVRKAEKTHGMQQRIEGFHKKGAKVFIVDDVCTTGGSTIEAIQAAREFGFEVVGILCLVEREEANGRANIEKAAPGVPFVSIYTSDDVRAEHLRIRRHEDDPLANLQAAE